VNKPRNPNGHYESTYPNLGKSKVVRIPENLLEEIKQLLSLMNKCSNNISIIRLILQQFISLMMDINNWDNDSKDAIQTLEKMVEAYHKISQKEKE
jgi:gas vesicle protein